MQTFNCKCGNTLFFGSHHCLNCGHDTIMCPDCETLTPVETGTSEMLRCGNPQCKAQLSRCDNDLNYNACNRAVSDSQPLCGYCRLNSVIPDLSVEENLGLWKKLEAAKHRVLWVVDQLGFPVSGREDLEPPLQFQFLADDVEPVATGHADGCITINLREADSVAREKTRVEFQEPKRTLVGHFRHELGHYYWDLLVKHERLDDFRRLYGDERHPSYSDAQQAYYQNGPAPDWGQRCVSAYASMHPWEDFAETFQAYLDMATILLTTKHFGVVREDIQQFDHMLTAYAQVGILANELNRDMGLLDLVPQVFTPPVVEKMRFIHDLRTETAGQQTKGPASRPGSAA